MKLLLALIFCFGLMMWSLKDIAFLEEKNKNAETNWYYITLSIVSSIFLSGAFYGVLYYLK